MGLLNVLGLVMFGEIYAGDVSIKNTRSSFFLPISDLKNRSKHCSCLTRNLIIAHERHRGT